MNVVFYYDHDGVVHAARGNRTTIKNKINAFYMRRIHFRSGVFFFLPFHDLTTGTKETRFSFHENSVSCLVDLYVLVVGRTGRRWMPSERERTREEVTS